MKRRRSLYARPVIVRGEQCAKARPRGRCWAVVQLRPGPRRRCRHRRAVMGPSTPRRCDRGEVWPPSGWSPVARMSGHRPHRSSPCPRPLSAVRTSVQADVRPSGHADVRCPRVRCPPTGAIQVSGRTGLGCPRLCSRAVRTALDPGTLGAARSVPVGRMGSMCRRGPRAAWSPTRMGLTGGMVLGWPWVARTRVDGRPWAAASHAHRLRPRLAGWPTRELVQRQGAGRLAGEHKNEQVRTRAPRCVLGRLPAWCPTMGGWTGRW
jgi:hypothetical protein